MQVKALQTESEIAAFCDIIRAEGVRSYLEIGSKYGGSLWRIANAMPKGSRVVAMDLPDCRETRRSLKGVVAELRALGYDASAILGDSSAPESVAAVKALGPFDCVFIDGDHRRAGIEADWANYGQDARIVAFHDISWRRPADWLGYHRIEAPEVWAEIKDGFRHQEITLDPDNNGIGILWRE
jgi:predicted O-methyltransferase YrrM